MEKRARTTGVNGGLSLGCMKGDSLMNCTLSAGSIKSATQPPHDPVAKHPTGGHDSKQQGRADRDEKLGNTENESEGSATARLILHNGGVEGRTGRKS
jgi:hypothetical protein